MSVPNSTIDYYEILEVAPSASPEVIEAAYQGLMRKYSQHPDPDVRERRAAVDEAHSVLSNPERRSAYDAARRGAAPGAAAPEPPRRLGGATLAQCARHPGVETALRCSRCDTPICPRCMIQTPVGARCPDCARISRSPIYTVRGVFLIRAIAAAVLGGTAMGLIWGFASRNVAGIAYGGIFISLILGAALGIGFTRIMEFATNRKRGPVIVACAIGGIVLATGIQVLFIDGTLFIGSIIAAGVGMYFAYQNLR